MLSHLSRFTRTTPGLEKTLRLIQSICVLALQVPDLNHVAISRFGIAKQQLALTRRFLRFFNFIECFNRVFGLLGTTPRSMSTDSRQSGGGSWGEMITTILEISKWSCFGCYFLLEDLTLLHATSIHPLPTTWNKTLLTEANKFWFYALLFSLLTSGMSFLSLSFSSSPSSSSNAKKNKRNPTTRSITPFSLFKKVLVDTCDLLIPGTFLGWIPMQQMGVGVGMVTSTLVSGWEIWRTI
ncbi:hypothetical protein BO78DRAFT_371055 [Aspergillus sclerotiicarbonarius CBS 121057]|uniref:PEX11 domain protein n=1 Tax=Aspergillus sclerotiicarbonarius (strain CBS 121057 / IBT 28362) TaxID=1448318 RepID=A0A319E5Z1_ASPSB|nr:hypothetical protein BO78DRAFT_371055 [Aspergillus sclerotiicarbonarius CBS 121057]